MQYVSALLASLMGCSLAVVEDLAGCTGIWRVPFPQLPAKTRELWSSPGA